MEASNMERGYQTTTTTRYKMYKKGRIWLFSAVVIGTGACSVTTIAHADAQDPATSTTLATTAPTATSVESTATSIVTTSPSSEITNSSVPSVPTSSSASQLSSATSSSITLESSEIVATPVLTEAVKTTSTTPINPATPASATGSSTSTTAEVISDAPLAADSATTADEPAPPTTEATAVETTATIFTDEHLDDMGIDVQTAHEDNALGIASLFHIFSNSTVLSADTNGNIATDHLIDGTTDFGTRGYDGDLFYIGHLSGTVLPNSFRANDSLIYVGNSVSSGWIDGHAVINRVKLTNVPADRLFKDSADTVYIDFDAYFKLLREKAATYYAQPDSAGVTYDFSNMNRRTIDVSDAFTYAIENHEAHVYASIPFSVLQAPQSLYVTGVSSGGPTLIINVIDDLTNVFEGMLVNLETKTEIEVDGDLLSSKERTEFDQSVILWNFGDDHLNYNFIMAGRFVGSILAPNAEVIGNVNIDGNIVADHVNIASGESHRFDLQTPSVTDPEDPTDPIDPEDPVDPEDPTDPIDPEEPVDPEEPTDPIDPENPVDPEKPTESDTSTTPEQDLDRENAVSIDRDTQTTAVTASSNTTTSNPVITMITAKHHSTKSTNNALPQTSDTATMSRGILVIVVFLVFGFKVMTIIVSVRPL